MTDPAPITVIIPAYNSEKFIGEAIKSVSNQTLSVAEMIVVDDGSADQTAAIAESFGARVLRQPNGGPAAARNAGIRAATQPWIAFLDADDLWLPEKISLQWRAVQLCPEVGVVAADYSSEEDDRVIIPSRLAELGHRYQEVRKLLIAPRCSYFPQSKDEYALANLSLTPSAMLMRRDLLMRVGLFDERLRYCEDLECFLRILSHCPLALIEQPVVRRRLHGANASRNLIKYHLGRLAVADKIIANPAMYPPRAGQIYSQRALPFLVPTGRLLLEEERRAEARLLFARSLGARFELRALLLWAGSWVPYKKLKRFLSVKRRLGKTFKHHGLRAGQSRAGRLAGRNSAER